MTLVPVVLLSVNPAGNAPKTIDQAYGTVPPEAVHVAEYSTPTCVGPVSGAQAIASGVWALATVTRQSKRAKMKQFARPGVGSPGNFRDLS